MNEWPQVFHSQWTLFFPSLYSYHSFLSSGLSSLCPFTVGIPSSRVRLLPRCFPPSPLSLLLSIVCTVVVNRTKTTSILQLLLVSHFHLLPFPSTLSISHALSLLTIRSHLRTITKLKLRRRRSIERKVRRPEG